jgi:hypothetical protein
MSVAYNRSPGGDMEEFDIRESLAAHIRQTADWRRSRFQDDLRDSRNLRSARALDDFAAFVLTIPSDDPRLRILATYASEGQSFIPGQQVLYEIGRFHFFDDETTFDAFLSQLAEFARGDHEEHGHFGGKQAPGDDPWG